MGIYSPYESRNLLILFKSLRSMIHGHEYGSMSELSTRKGQSNASTSTVAIASKRFPQRQHTRLYYLHQPHHIMALLVDKHRPRSLDQLSYHDDLSERLRSLVSLPFHSPTPQLTPLPPRHNPETSPIFSSTVPLAQARKPAS